MQVRVATSSFSWAHTTNPIIKHLTNVQHTCTQAFTRAATRRQPNRHRERHTEIKGPVVERFRSPIRIPVEKNAWLIKNRWRNSDAAALSSICKQESQTSTDRLSSLIIPRLPLVIIVNPSQQSSHSELTVSHKHCQHQSHNYQYTENPDVYAKQVWFYQETAERLAEVSVSLQKAVIFQIIYILRDLKRL